MSELEAYLYDYRDLTVKLIEVVESENYDSIEALFEKRQTLIESLNKLDYRHEDFKIICNRLGIVSLEQKLNNIMNEKFSGIKGEMKKLSAGKSINRSYKNNFSVDSIFFNKKV